MSHIHSCLYRVCLFAGCLTSQQHASVSQGRICSDNFTCCHTEIEVADQTFHLIQSLECQFLSYSYDSTPKKIPAQAAFEPGIFHSRGGCLNHQADEAVCLYRGRNQQLHVWKKYVIFFNKQIVYARLATLIYYTRKA